MGRNDIRIQMLDYVISTFYPEIQATHTSDTVQRNAAFFREVGSGGHQAHLPGAGAGAGSGLFPREVGTAQAGVQGRPALVTPEPTCCCTRFLPVFARGELSSQLPDPGRGG